MSRDLVARFVLRLQDRASAGLSALQRRLNSLARSAQRIALIGGALAGLSVAGPVREAAALERTMRQTAITAGLSGAAVEQMMSRNLAMFQSVARETNVRVSELATAAGTLVAGGGEAGAVWEQLVPVIGRVAAASGANAGDLAQSVLSMVNNLKLGPGEVEQALASMVQAGKEGQFELRDMAREFASLTAAAAGVGLSGPRAVHSLAAALQVARQGAGSAGEAATNLTNILQKMTAPDAVRNFRDMGVDLEAVLADAGRRGINPIEAVIQKIRELTGGNMFRVSELFADSQVLAFLRPMIQQTERYIEVRDRAAGADASLIGVDQESAMRGLDAAIRRLTVGYDEFATRIGGASEGPIRAAGTALIWLADQLKALDERFPGLVDNAALVLAGFVALSAGIGALGLVAGPLAAGLGVIGTGLAALFSPIGLLAALFVGAAIYIWSEWDRFRGLFQGMLDGLRTALSGLGAFLTGVFTGDVQGAITGLMQLWDGLAAYLQNLWGVVRTLFTDFGTFLDGWSGGAITAAVERVRAAFAGLGAWFAGFWDGVKAPFDAFIGGVLAGLERLQQVWASVRERFGQGQAAEGQGPAIGGVQARQAAARAAMASPGDLAGAAGVGTAANSNAPVNGEIMVRAAPGSEVVSAEGSNRNVPVTAAPDRGATRARR